jgi:hypothetical protein
VLALDALDHVPEALMKPRGYPQPTMTARRAETALGLLLAGCTAERLAGFTAEGLAGSYNVGVERVAAMLAEARRRRG